MKNFINTPKKKIVTTVACTALILTFGATTAFAANNALEKGFMMMKNENGISSYSTDEGATWNEGIPAGAVLTQNDDGSSTVTMGEAPTHGNGSPFTIKNENGIISYSNDNGETWTEGMPEGMTFETNGSESINFMN